MIPKDDQRLYILRGIVKRITVLSTQSVFNNDENSQGIYKLFIDKYQTICFPIHVNTCGKRSSFITPKRKKMASKIDLIGGFVTDKFQKVIENISMISLDERSSVKKKKKKKRTSAIDKQSFPTKGS